MKSELKALRNAIHIQNEYYRVAGPILDAIKTASKPFIDKKITTQKGLSAKFADAVRYDKATKESFVVKPIPGTKWANVHYVSVKDSYNSLSVEISICFSLGESGCTYESRSWYFGRTKDDGILHDIDDSCKVLTIILDYDTELKAIKKFRELEQLATNAEEEINVNRDAYKYINLSDFK